MWHSVTHSSQKANYEQLAHFFQTFVFSDLTRIDSRQWRVLKLRVGVNLFAILVRDDIGLLVPSSILQRGNLVRLTEGAELKTPLRMLVEPLWGHLHKVVKGIVFVFAIRPKVCRSFDNAMRLVNILSIGVWTGRRAHCASVFSCLSIVLRWCPQWGGSSSTLGKIGIFSKYHGFFLVDSHALF